MVSLIDSLLPDVWQEVEASKRGDGWVEYHINRQKKFTDPNTLSLFLTDDNGDPKTAILKGTQPNSDPVKSVARCEFKLNGEEIVGMDLNGDVVLRK